MTAGSFLLRPVRSAEDRRDAAALVAAYGASLGVDLAYQGFAEELAGLPGRYAPPGGEMLLARAGGPGAAPLGCVALRPLGPAGTAEMKRLYVVPAGRGMGLGLALVEAVLGEARRMGYARVVLDTLPFMAEAAALYRRAGFVEIEPYYETPVAGTIFLGRALGA
ncbi:GNAT family N-acetyltransferase [Roseomonas nepalensis]|uniref:GNAT family N-acetyltransferase n=1 Tax=Muricoccus nepalensis TaxID=1854500 RepID=A0A502FR87_9PROT|nr:GNAT family N-acetyltransferase [Roseomonas nepalensis]TPG51533.1 GNAT family N-acetyltransferase [Roseomonas nepalensis]